MVLLEYEVMNGMEWLSMTDFEELGPIATLALE
jgi:hypothetical protein